MLFAEQPSPDSAPVCLLSTSSSMEQFSCELLPAQRRLLEDPVHLGVARRGHVTAASWPWLCCAACVFIEVG